FRLAVKSGSQLVYIHVPKALAEGKEAVRNILPEKVLTWRKSRVERKRLADVSGRTDEPRSSFTNRMAAAIYGIAPVRRAGGRFADAFRNAAPERPWSFV